MKRLDRYHFYLEFDGKRTHAKAYDAPVEQIMATDIHQAIERFCRRKHLECVQYEALSDEAYRAYMVKKAFLKPPVEQVYYIEVSLS